MDRCTITNALDFIAAVACSESYSAYTLLHSLATRLLTIPSPPLIGSKWQSLLLNSPSSTIALELHISVFPSHGPKAPLKSTFFTDVYFPGRRRSPNAGYQGPIPTIIVTNYAERDAPLYDIGVCPVSMAYEAMKSGNGLLWYGWAPKGGVRPPLDRGDRNAVLAMKRGEDGESSDEEEEEDESDEEELEEELKACGIEFGDYSDDEEEEEDSSSDEYNSEDDEDEEDTDATEMCDSDDEETKDDSSTCGIDIAFGD